MWSTEYSLLNFPTMEGMLTMHVIIWSMGLSQIYLHKVEKYLVIYSTLKIRG